MTGTCETCGCVVELTKHHLIPQVVCRNKYKKAKNDSDNFAWICRTCHDQIHALFSEQELRDRFNTVESLLSDERFAKFVSWKKRHPDFSGSSKLSNRLR